MEKITHKELLEITENLYLGTNEIMKIGYVGKNRAVKIKKEINFELEAEGAYVHKDVVPTEKVIYYFGLKEVLNALRKNKNA